MRDAFGGLVCMLLVVPCVSACGARAGRAPLTEARAKALVAEAASCEPERLEALFAGGAPRADLPLTLAALTREVDGALHRNDLAYTGATPATLREALYPHAVRDGRRVPVYARASLIHAEYVTSVTLTQLKDGAWGDVAFGVQGLYTGRVRYRIRRVDGAWRVTELGFPVSEVVVTLVDGRWTLHLPAHLRGVNPLRGKELTLPRVTQVGREPARSARILLSVTRDGYLRADGAPGPVSLGALLEHLDALLEARGESWVEPDGCSKVGVLLDVDAGTPWLICQWLMQVCADPRLKLYKLFFGASAQTDERGALAAVLPRDRCGPSPWWREDGPAIHRVKLFRPKDAGPSDLRALWAALLEKPEKERRRARFEIIVPPPNGLIAVESVLQVLDVVLRAGARDVTFEGAAMARGEAIWDDAEALAAHIRELRGQTVRPLIKLDQLRLEDLPADVPELPRGGRVERFVGAGAEYLGEDVNRLVEEEILEEEVEETDEATGEDEPLGEEPVVKDLPDEEPFSPYEGPPGIGPARPGSFPMRPKRGKPALGAPRTAREQAIEDGLAWLAAHQAPDGGWKAATFADVCDEKPVAAHAPRADGAGEAAHDVGVSALAVNAFLGAGYTHRGAHPFRKVVSRGLRYLKNVQDPEGCFGPRPGQAWVYGHAFASLAMVDAYGMTRSPIFKGASQRALDFVALMRNPYFGWRYGVKPGDNDTSVTACMLAVLQSARFINADALEQGRQAPLTVDEAAFEGARAWLDRLTDPATGRVGYVQRGVGPARTTGNRERFPAASSEATTAMGVLARLWMGLDPARDPLLGAGVRLVTALPPRWDPTDGSIDMLYWYWGALAAFQAQGTAWAAWEPALQAAIVASQRHDTDVCLYRGSWDPVGPWGPDGGRVYATALLTLCLETADRYPRVRAPR